MAELRATHNRKWRCARGFTILIVIMFAPDTPKAGNKGSPFRLKTATRCFLTVFCFFCVLLFGGPARAKEVRSPEIETHGGARQIVGCWLTQKGDARVQFYEDGRNEGRFLGRLAWLKEPNGDNGRPALDENNPDPALRNHPILGLVIVHVAYSGRGSWKGTVYDPDNGKTFSCHISMSGPGTLKLRGYLGISLFGRTETWKRVKGNF